MSRAGSPPGRVLAVDHGTRRVGLAISDPLRLTASPFEVVPVEDAVERIRQIVVEHAVVEIVVGLPVTLSGAEGHSARLAREFASRLAPEVGVPLTLVDERFTTTTAERAMLEAGVKRRKRRQSRDKVAATVILRSFLDRRR